jgi:glycosidase
VSPWPKHPVIYEINAWTWLRGLGRKCRRRVTLGTVPMEEWDALAAWGFDAVWLMGVWERSPVGIQVARAHQALQADFRRALPDFTSEDVVGSPYCVHRYVVDEHLGGPEELVAARWALANRGMRLVLDFVPNHVAQDHPWILAHPEYFIRGSGEDLARPPAEFFEAGGTVFACGRDPFFPPWTDVAQLNAFHPGLRRAVIDTLDGVGKQCDGLRCDMAMLIINRVFEQTWGHRPGARPAEEYWREVIGAVRTRHPDLLFMAEAYWDLEWELQQQGFEFCYDKRLYDRLEHGSAEAVQLHLSGDPAYQNKLVRFIENHDEPRAAAIFSPWKSRAAAVAIATLPGAKLLHEGQFEGRQVRLPVQLGRRPDEAEDPDLRAFYRTLLRAVRAPAFREGEWLLCERTGWPDNQSCSNLVAWCWRKGEERHLVVVNLSDRRSQAHVRLPWGDLAGRSWRLTDELSGSVYERSGDEMRNLGPYVELDAWGYHFLTLGVYS